MSTSMLSLIALAAASAQQAPSASSGLQSPESTTAQRVAIPTTSDSELHGRALRLVPSAPFQAPIGAEGAQASGLRAEDARWLFNQQTGWNPAPLTGAASSQSQTSSRVSGVRSFGSGPAAHGTQNTGTAGCDTGVASPAVGANIPGSYFGNPSPGSNPSFPGSVQLLTSGTVDVENQTVTLPLYEGSMFGSGETVWYIATDTSDEANAQALGLNHSAKLTFSEVGRGTRDATLDQNGELVFFGGRVDFSPERSVTPGPANRPFPPAAVQPGSVGESTYTPLVKVVNAGGHIFNVPTIATGDASNLLDANGDPDYRFVHDSVLGFDFAEETVTLALASGFSFGRAVLYISTDSNSPVAAALEGSTLAPGLDDITVGNDDSLFSAVERIFITTNGAEGCENPQRQGLFAAITDGASPFNVLGGIPTIAPDYSPLWDANFGEWTQDSIDSGFRSRLIDEFQILGFVEDGFMTGPGGMPYGSSGVIINCPIVQRLL